MAIEKFKVGDTVLVTSVNDRGRGPVERTVVKVGRVNITLDGGFYPGREKTYNAETARTYETGQYTHEAVYTLQEWADVQERKGLVDRYRAAGLDEIYRSRFSKITNDQLRRILAIVEEDK